MRRVEMSDRTFTHAKPMLGIVSGLIGVSLLTFGAVVSMAPPPASALPAYSQQTGLGCGRCHVNPAGGGPNTAFGKAFAANGHKLPSKKK
jgi:hypothetical protein